MTFTAKNCATEWVLKQKCSKEKRLTNGISKFPQPSVDEAMNCSMHLVKVQGER